MNNNYRIGLWNANGLSQRTLELKAFLIENRLDVMLISETHFTDRSHIRIPGFTVYDTQHPDGTARGGTALLIRNNIKHYLFSKVKTAHLQATNVLIEDQRGPLIAVSYTHLDVYKRQPLAFLQASTLFGMLSISLQHSSLEI